jgi:hypothetical protein
MYVDYILTRAHDVKHFGIFVNSAFLRNTLSRVYLYKAADSSFRKFEMLSQVQVRAQAGWQYFDLTNGGDKPAPEARYLRLYAKDTAGKFDDDVFFETSFFGSRTKLTLDCPVGSVPVTSTECQKCEKDTYAYFGDEWAYCRNCEGGLVAPVRGSTRCVAPAKECSHTKCEWLEGNHKICGTTKGTAPCSTASFGHIHTKHHSSEEHGTKVKCAYNKVEKKCHCMCIMNTVQDKAAVAV